MVCKCGVNNGISRRIISIFIVITFIFSIFVVVNVDSVYSVDISDCDVGGSESVVMGSTRSGDIVRGQFWTEYPNGTVDKSRFPINYWNEIESEWLPIDKNIYRSYFGDYEWQNSKNTFDSYFKKYVGNDMVKLRFYKLYNDIRTPTEIMFDVNSLYWFNDTQNEIISYSNTGSEGVVDGNIIGYNPFTDCIEILSIENNNILNVFKFDDIATSYLGDIVSLGIRGNLTIDNLMNIYVDGVYWDGSGVKYGDIIEFGFGVNDTVYRLNSITAFDNNMIYLDGNYSIRYIGDNIYEYSINVYYEDFGSLSYPLVIDPVWWATNTALLDVNCSNDDNGFSGKLAVGGDDSRNDEQSFLDGNLSTMSDGSIELSKNIYTHKEYWNYENYSDDSDMTPGEYNWDVLDGNLPNVVEELVSKNSYELKDINGLNTGVDIYALGTRGPKIRSSIRGGPETNYYYNVGDIFSGGSIITDGTDSYINTTTALSVGSVSYMEHRDCRLDFDLIVNGEVSEHIGAVDFDLFDQHPYAGGETWGEGRVLDRYNNVRYEWDVGYYLQYDDITVMWSREIYFSLEYIDFTDNSYCVKVGINHYEGPTTYTMWHTSFSTPVSSINGFQVSFYSWVPGGSYVTYWLSIDDFSLCSGGSIDCGYSDLGHGFSKSVNVSQDYVVSGTDENGFIYRWEYFAFNTVQPASTDVKIRLYYDYLGSWVLVPNSVIPLNSVGYDGDGDEVIVNLTGLSKTVYYKLRVEFMLSTTDNKTTPIINWWSFGLVKAKNVGSICSADIYLYNLIVEVLSSDYSGGGNIIVDLGEITSEVWGNNPYMRLYYIDEVESQPDINDIRWTKISADLYYSLSGAGGWSVISNADDAVIDLSNPNSGDMFAYLWYPILSSDISNCWFKAVIRDNSWYSVDIPNKVLFIISEMSSDIYANKAPVASVVDRTVMATDVVMFDADIDNCDGGPYGGVMSVDTCEWNFSGPYSFEEVYNKTVMSNEDGRVIISFPRSGKYFVNLIIVDVYGLVSRDGAVITVSNNGPMIVWKVDGESTPYELNVYNNYYFDATGSIDIDGSIVMFSWDWGDGNWTNKTPAEGGDYVMYQWIETGNYSVTLYVEDDIGFIDYDRKYVELFLGRPIAVIADVNGNDISGQTIEVVQYERTTFKAGLSSAGSGDIVCYTWYWGDGNIDYLDSSISSHIYNIVGKYYMELSVNTSLELYDTEFCFIDVLEAQENISGEGGELSSLGKNPRFMYNITSVTDNLTLDVSARMIHDGWGGAWLERYVFKESLSVSIIRVSGPFDSTGDGNNTTSVDNEIFEISATYFDKKINVGGEIGYGGNIGDDIYIYVRVDNVWYLCNVDKPLGLGIVVSSGAIHITFDGVWQEVKVITNPGLFMKLSLWFGGKNFTPSDMSIFSFSGIEYMEACIKCEH